MRIPAAIVSLGALAAAAGVLALLMTRAAQAIAATLVQVANTMSSPVPAFDVFRTASQSVTLYCDGQDACSAVGTGGSLANSPYMVPAGETLVITELEINPPSGGRAFSNFVLTYDGSPFDCPAAPCQDPTWIVPNDGLTHQFLFPNGVLWPAGQRVYGFTSTASGVSAVARGYLTSN
jgi:hypothetical protein